MFYLFCMQNEISTSLCSPKLKMQCIMIKFHALSCKVTPIKLFLSRKEVFKKEGKPLTLSRWTSLLFYWIFGMQDNHLPRYWKGWTWFVISKEESLRPSLWSRNLRMERRHFCILNSASQARLQELHLKEFTEATVNYRAASHRPLLDTMLL